MMARALFAGVDVREDPRLPGRSWDDARRREYLLQRDVRRPLSVDRGVWPEVRGPDGRSVAKRLPWVTLDEVRGRLSSLPEPQRDRSVLVVVGVVSASPDDEELLRRTIGVDAELRVDPAWTSLGYDVADGGISGLCNCGYREEDEQMIPRAIWAPRLNEHGLFDDVDHALAFRDLTDRRVPEHAPFFVYGLWMISDAALNV